MNKELKVIISAETEKFKKGIADAKNQVGDFQKKAEQDGKKIDESFKKIGDNIGNAISKGAKVAAKAIASMGAALGGIGTAAVKSYADYEQLVGGVNKLFGKSSNVVQEYAAQAYKTAGISANEYMTQVTGFSSALINSLGGDTAKAAALADMAMRDMADNVNTFGSNMEDVQNAISGLARGNYTMLDNLKLGFAGSKEGMQGLIDKANELRAANGNMSKLSIDSYADMLTAIHEVQVEMGITGTTEIEAAGTISGSIAMTKAAWENLLAALGSGEIDIADLAKKLAESVEAVIKNIIPVIKEVFRNIPVAISEISPKAGAAMQKVVDAMGSVIPALTEALKTAFSIIEDIILFVANNTGVIAAIAGVIATVTTAIGLYNAVAAVKAAMDAKQVTTLGGLIAAEWAQVAAQAAVLAPYVAIVAAIAAVIAIIVLLVKHWDEIKETAINVANKVKETVAEMFAKVKEVFENIKNAITEKITAAKEAVTNVFNGIKSAISEKIDAAKNVVSSAVTWIKEHLSFSGLVSAVGGVFGSIKSAISEKLTAASDFVRGAIDKIKSFFHFDWSLPKLKLPHISITGEFSLLPPHAPSFGIEWYARGGVFDKPTYFNSPSGLAGLGEAGAEAVVPLEKNTEWLDKIAERLGANGREIVIELDGRELGRAAIDSINGITRQTGKLALIVG